MSKAKAPSAKKGLHVGDAIHGFANGYFGRDSYSCRVVEAEGRDWFVTRNTKGVAEFIDRVDADAIRDPSDLSYCGGACDFPPGDGGID